MHCPSFLREDVLFRATMHTMYTINMCRFLGRIWIVEIDQCILWYNWNSTDLSQYRGQHAVVEVHVFISQYLTD
jgi:hypothetical protein